LFGKRLNRRQTREGRVSVVGAAASVQPLVLDDGDPGAEAVAPTVHFRLLVQMTVKKHAIVVLAISLSIPLAIPLSTRHFHEDERCASVEPQHLDAHARQRVLAAPALDQGDRLFHVPVAVPIGVECW
jgi:hypothetical protein